MTLDSVGASDLPAVVRDVSATICLTNVLDQRHAHSYTDSCVCYYWVSFKHADHDISTDGGGFSTGGEDVPYQIPAQWVNTTPYHLVVSLNYRVNIFGFPNAAGLGEQNFGLLDQRAAVEWCKKNIAAFGGHRESYSS